MLQIFQQVRSLSEIKYKYFASISTKYSLAYNYIFISLHVSASDIYIRATEPVTEQQNNLTTSHKTAKERTVSILHDTAYTTPKYRRRKCSYIRTFLP
jgi:hypothetical protein